MRYDYKNTKTIFKLSQLGQSVDSLFKFFFDD